MWLRYREAGETNLCSKSQELFGTTDKKLQKRVPFSHYIQIKKYGLVARRCPQCTGNDGGHFENWLH